MSQRSLVLKCSYFNFCKILFPVLPRAKFYEFLTKIVIYGINSWLFHHLLSVKRRQMRQENTCYLNLYLEMLLNVIQFGKFCMIYVGLYVSFYRRRYRLHGFPSILLFTQEELVAQFEELYEELQQGRLTSPHIDQIYDQLIGRLTPPNKLIIYR